jgi:hypothetical protein
MDEPETIIAATVKRCAPRSADALAQAILEELWDAGYEVRPKSDPDANPV